ncbi:DNA-binding response regulator [Virgibacillus profundi]|uniref:DNA-binding response regulator n=1 Tax=Virgibacillus profundi TaxID=2024555 RepID=A0A2A2IH48_9BACI|nr:response regulator transcription factor [Virgibacillus profundi]PAV31099.1 DNA-binding response regulator [Virgibacillus profundi]PXY55282.1 DNA-binding response regulator [Virgibacillus profundi]
MISVLLVEDQQLFREGVHALIATVDDMDVVGMASNGEEATQLMKKSQADIVIMDIHMPNVDGIKATIHLKDNYPSVKVILLTTFAEEDLIITGLAAGADGFLLKSLDRARLIRSIRDVYDDQVVLSGEAAKILATMIVDIKYNKKDLLEKKLVNRNINLSNRELDIAYLMMNGSTNKLIAQKLFLSEGTIKNYISELYNKLNLRSRKDVIDFLLELISKKSYR